MAQTLNHEHRSGSHARPSDARKASDAGQPSKVKEIRRFGSGDRSSLHILAAKAMNRKVSREIDDSRKSIDEDDLSSIPSGRERSSTKSSTQERRDSGSANSSNATQGRTRIPTLAEVDLPLHSAEFQRQESRPFEMVSESDPQHSPASNVSLEGLQERIATNELISAEIEALASDIDGAFTIAELNEMITSAIIEYYDGNGYSMLQDLSRVAAAAQNYAKTAKRFVFQSIAARAQLWQAMILHGADDTAHVAETLTGILNVIVYNKECTDADRYHMRRLVLLYGDEMWLRLQTDLSNQARGEHTLMHPESPNTQQRMQEWRSTVVKGLESRMRDNTGMWPSIHESPYSTGEGPGQEGASLDGIPADLWAQLEQLRNRNAQLEADVARYRAEREIYSELSTPDYPPPPDNRQSLTQRPELIPGRTHSGESWLGARSMSDSASPWRAVPNRTLHYQPGIGYGTILQDNTSSSRRSLSKQPNTSHSRERRPLRVRNKTPGGSGHSSRRFSSPRSSGRRFRSSQSLNWRTGASLDKERQNGVPGTDETVPERRGSNLRNMALAESSNEEQEEGISPKAVSHRRPSSMQRRPLAANDSKGLDKFLAEVEKHPAVFSGTIINDHNGQLGPWSEPYAEGFDNGQARRRSSTSNPDAILQIDAEEYEMTGALSPTEIEQRYPKLAQHKEQERRKSETVRKTPSSSDYPSYEALAEKLRNGDNRRRRPEAPQPGAKAIPAVIAVKAVPSPEQAQKLVLHSTAAGKTPERKPNLEPIRSSPKFDFDHIQQTPQAGKRRSFHAPLKNNLLRDRNRSIAPFTPESKSPPSSAISVPRYFNENAITESPQSFEFDNVVPRDDKDPSPAPAKTPVADLQILQPTAYKPDPPVRRHILPPIQDLVPGDTDNSQSSDQSQDFSQNPRISRFIQELQWAQNAQVPRTNPAQAYAVPLRRDSKPDISSPLRTSWDAFEPPGPDYGRVGSMNPMQPSNIDTTAGNSERTNSIYDRIGNEYPSPLEENKDDGYETDIDGRKGRGRRLRIKT